MAGRPAYKHPVTGISLPSVTTVLDAVLRKKALEMWMYNQGKAGLSLEKTRGDALSTGTLLHSMVQADILSEPLTKQYLADFTPNQVSGAETAMVKYYDWVKENPFEVMLTESPMVHDSFGYGGTPDLVCTFTKTGKVALCDWKTSNGIWDDYLYQLAAYRILVEHNHPEISIDECHILRFGKDDMSDFEDKRIVNTDKEFQIFKHCLGIYQLKKGDK